MSMGLEFAEQAFPSGIVYPVTVSSFLAYTAGQATG
jgi:hypothetical protein